MKSICDELQRNWWYGYRLQDVCQITENLISHDQDHTH